MLALRVLILICLMLAGACGYTSQSAMREDFEREMKNFNKMLRWQEMERAGMTYATPEMRESFMKEAESARKREVSITDYRVLASDCEPDEKSATSVTLLEYYALPSNRIKSVTYYQQWVFGEKGGKRMWQIKTPLPLFE